MNQNAEASGRWILPGMRRNWAESSSHNRSESSCKCPAASRIAVAPVGLEAKYQKKKLDSRCIS